MKGFTFPWVIIQYLLGWFSGGFVAAAIFIAATQPKNDGLIVVAVFASLFALLLALVVEDEK